MDSEGVAPSSGDDYKPQTMTEESSGVEVVVIGAGFAGAATALALARDGHSGVLVIEAEKGPGHHASGRNAAMARRLVADPLLAGLATQSLELLRELEVRRDIQLLDPVGGMLIGDSADCHRLLRTAQEVEGLGEETQALEGAELVERVPALRGATSSAAVYSSGCGVVDIHGLLTTLIEEARSLGVRFMYDSPVERIEVKDSRVAAVSIAYETYWCDNIVNAAGHRAGIIGTMAGAQELPLRPSRRHLYVTEGAGRVTPGAPYVWDITHGFYFRPEGDGLLLCACDETLWPDEELVVDPGHRDALAQVFLSHAPALGDVRPTRSWVGLRTGTPDGRFILGPDPTVGGFTWAAGLGGHGMTTALGVGELVASSVMEGRVPEPYGVAFAPERWFEGHASWHAR